MRGGLRGFPSGSSLAKLLAAQRGVRNFKDLPQFSEAQIVAWAESYFNRGSQWPNKDCGRIDESPEESWAAVDAALRQGSRGLPGGSSLPQLLAKECGVRNTAELSSLSEREILAWADAHYERNRCWPKRDAGPIEEAAGETWRIVEGALQKGHRGLPGGSSLSRLLAKHRALSNAQDLPELTEGQILGWADAHFVRTGQWPKRTDGSLDGVPGENWAKLDRALNKGRRALLGGSSLAQLLSRHRGVRNRLDAPILTVPQILEWTDSFHNRRNTWPTQFSGAVDGVFGETWSSINGALRSGGRGLPGGSSLAMLVADHRGVRNIQDLPSLNIAQILAWIGAHYKRTGVWPKKDSGEIVEGPGETWACVNWALAKGRRSLLGGSSLARLVREHRTTTVT